MNEKTLEKLKILADAAKYDVSCVSSGVDRKNKQIGGLGNAAASGICHTWTADGRCVSLLKILLTNDCIFDCTYCMSRVSNDTARATFTPEEIAELTIEFYKRNYIEGLFLSSAVNISPNKTMENIYRALLLIRNKYKFGGYIHVKVIPGADPELIEKTGFLADRMSVNIELPTKESLKLLAPQKKAEKLLLPMNQIKKQTDINVEERRKYRYAKKFVPGGQSTQVIVGATRDTDHTILDLSQNLYDKLSMKRVFFSAYVPIMTSPNLPAISTVPPLKREHRLYQADWLMRFYKFRSDELFTDTDKNLDLEFDPKMIWALRNIEKFPIEVNTASYDELLRIPGFGVLTVNRIIKERKLAHLSYDSLRRMRTALNRAKFFITVKGKYYGMTNIEPEIIKDKIRIKENSEQLSLFQFV